MCIYIYIYYVFSPRYAFTSKVSQEIWPWKIRSIPPERFPSFEETATREILPRLLVVFNNIDEEDVCLDHWVVSLVCCHFFITKLPQHIWYSPLGNKGYKSSYFNFNNHDGWSFVVHHRLTFWWKDWGSDWFLMMLSFLNACDSWRTCFLMFIT